MIFWCASKYSNIDISQPQYNFHWSGNETACINSHLTAAAALEEGNTVQHLAEAEEGNTVPEVGTVPGEDIARGVGTGREAGIGRQVTGTVHLDLWTRKVMQR